MINTLVFYLFIHWNVSSMTFKVLLSSHPYPWPSKQARLFSTLTSSIFQEQEMLRLMASTSPEGKQLYQQWIIQDNRNIIHILEDLPSCKPEIDHVCELLPRLQCRYYSISSSPKVYILEKLSVYFNHKVVYQSDPINLILVTVVLN